MPCRSNTNTSLTPYDLYHIIDNLILNAGQHLPITITKFMKLWTEWSEYPLISLNTTKGEVDIKQESGMIIQVKKV